MTGTRSGKGPSQRQLRVGELVRHALTEILQRGEISDPRLDNTVVSVNEVAMSPDLKIATAFVSPLGRGESEPVIKALVQNAKYIRGRLTPFLKQMKYMPEIRFRADTSFDNYSKIESLLHSPEVSRDLEPGEGDG